MSEIIQQFDLPAKPTSEPGEILVVDHKDENKPAVSGGYIRIVYRSEVVGGPESSLIRWVPWRMYHSGGIFGRQ